MAGRMRQIAPTRRVKPDPFNDTRPATSEKSVHWSDVLLSLMGCAAVALLFFGAYYR